MNKRFSKKRQAILKCLEQTKIHPTADWIYSQLKSEFPDLSIGTVYRNLNELKESGEISSVAVVLDKERYDYVTTPHIHVICSVCGKITDLDGISFPQELISDAQRLTEYSISETRLQFVGVCNECKEKEKQNG